MGTGTAVRSLLMTAPDWMESTSSFPVSNPTRSTYCSPMADTLLIVAPTSAGTSADFSILIVTATSAPDRSTSVTLPIVTPR